MSKSKACWPATPAALIDIKAKVSAADTTTDFLNSKIVAGAGISKAILNPGANETLEISAPGSTTDEKVKASAGDTTAAYLDTKLAAGTNITLTKQNPGANENYLIACTAADVKAKVTAADTTTNYLDSKIVAGSGITKTVLNPGANETLEIKMTAAATDINAKVTVNDTTTNYLDSKIVAGTGITKTVLNPGANETLEIKVTTAGKTKVLWQENLSPDDFQLNGGAQLQTAASPVNSVRFWYIDLPEGSDIEVDIAMHPKYDESGIALKCHWFCDDGSHGTEHTIKYYARFYRDGDTMDAGQTQRAFPGWTDAASWTKYIDSVSPITVEGAYAAAGTNLHLTILHTPDCPASGNNRVLCVELQYYVTLD